MTIYQIGSAGPAVKLIQEALHAEGLYRGPVDGVFGGGTLSGIVQFQNNHHLVQDGKVGPATWATLIGQHEFPTSGMATASLTYRCLALTGHFETGRGAPECFCGINGDFDGQGLSFGVLQWNFGQGTLQPLLSEMVTKHDAIVRAIFGDHFDTLNNVLSLGPNDHEVMQFVRSIQYKSFKIYEPWNGYALALGRTDEFQQIQVEHAQDVFKKAQQLCAQYGLWSERAVALMFDIVVQNGSINTTVGRLIECDIKHLSSTLSEQEREAAVLAIVANRRADAASPTYADDVRRRKLCIATGRGTVHGIAYDLDADYCIKLQRCAADR